MLLTILLILDIPKSYHTVLYSCVRYS